MAQNGHDATCPTCGAAWSCGAHTPACATCDGGALTRPCPNCGGACGAVWHRAVLDTNDTGKAHWFGRCRMADVGAPSSPAAASSPQSPFLFRFGYFTPTQVRNMRAHPEWDDEDSAAVFILAANEAAAIALGSEFADAFVARLYALDATPDPDGAYTWSHAPFAHWIETEPSEIANARAWGVPTIRAAADFSSAIEELAAT